MDLLIQEHSAELEKRIRLWEKQRELSYQVFKTKAIVLEKFYSKIKDIFKTLK